MSGSERRLAATLTLAPEPASAAAARELVQERLGEWECDELIDDARTVVTELVSNVVRHAGTELVVLLELHRDVVRVGVTDADASAEPVLQVDPGLDDGGRGLHIIEELSDQWGVERATDGSKTVWAEWRLERPSPRS